MVVYSVYFQTGQEVTEEKLHTLIKLFDHVNTHGLPWLAGGD